MLGNNRGVALILTLWIMVALVLIAAGIATMTRTETQISRNYADVVRCRWAARAGVYGAMTSIKTLAANPFTYLGEDPYTVSSDDLSIDLGGFTFQATIEDEAGKININSAGAATLASVFGSTETADCVLDWRNPANKPSADGAETAYYSALDPPYTCKNGPFDTVLELQLVKDITPDLLSQPMAQGSVPLTDLITVYAPIYQPHVNSAGLVNIQSASQQTLQSSLGSVLNARNIAAIIGYRSKTPFHVPAEIVQVPGLTRSQIEQIYDKLTVSGASVPAARVNINTASVDALSIQPGLDQSIAQAIVNYRTQNGGFTSVGDLLAINDVTNSAFVSSAPQLTTKSSVFKIVSTGSLPTTGASATITCIAEVDGPGQTQIRYWQE